MLRNRRGGREKEDETRIIIETPNIFFQVSLEMFMKNWWQVIVWQFLVARREEGGGGFVSYRFLFHEH